MKKISTTVVTTIVVGALQFICLHNSYAIVLPVLHSYDVLQQQTAFSGKVKNEDGEPLVGVTVSVRNKKIVTTTNAQGEFTIRADANDVLVFTNVGYVTQTYKIGSAKSIDIVLHSSDEQLGEVMVLGSRVQGRVNVETPVPVDVFDIQKLNKEVPQVNLNQMLNYIAPSFTSNTQTIADGTDHIDPAQLRGLGPDQVLVLVNGKRRHTSSLVNINGTPGRGSVGTDLNAIPSFAINKLEVLRDGAAAQYGSDAIAGVINLGMKRSVGKFSGMLNTGANNYNGRMDGGNLQLDLNYGVRLGKKGFINFTGSSQLRDYTNRAGQESNTIYNAFNAIDYRAQQGGININGMFSNINNTINTEQIIGAIKQFSPQVTYLSANTLSSIQNATTITELQSLLNFDVTGNELAYRRLQRSDFNMRVGQSQLASGQFFANSEVPINNDWKLYSFGGLSYRDGLSTGFYRKPNQSRSYTGLYANGFLPEIRSHIYDYSFATGIKGKFKNDIYIDFSNTWGKNQFNYGVENSINTTLGMQSPTKFNSGTLAFAQNTTNLDLSKSINFWNMNFAAGAELRLENFEIAAGIPNSYLSYDINGKVVTATTPTNLLVTDFFGATRPGGAQVFPGYRVENQLSKNRRSYAGYADVELSPTKWMLFNAAFRTENYTDFGSTYNYKFASRFKLTDRLNLRLATNTGFRAPSLSQIYFNTTSTQFLGGVANEVGTFSNDSQMAKLLGIPRLKQETSLSYSGGLSYKIPSAGLTFSTDVYWVKINNKVVLTDQFSRPSGTYVGNSPQKTLQTLFDQANATVANFFANAIDTRTRGVDVVISHKIKFAAMSLNNDFALNLNKTERVGNIHASQVLSAAGQVNNYYSEATNIYLTQATPRLKFNLSHSLTYGNISVFLRNTYFGKVTDPNTADVNGDGIVGAQLINGKAVENEHPVYKAKIITDLSFTYNFPKKIGLTIGTNNLFDIYPDKNLGSQYAKRPSGVNNGLIQYNNAPVLIDLANNNQFVYSRNVSQFGFNGRYVFMRLTYGF